MTDFLLYYFQKPILIAYALGTKEYQEFLKSSNDQSKRDKDIQFEDKVGDSKFFVRVYLVSEFENFRQQVFVGNDFIASLSGCDSWQTSGGKSGATFFKTSDGRFLLKEVKDTESKTFQKISKRYFDYLTNANERSCMAKIIGLYTVAYKTMSSSLKKNFIVMENLFYNHRISESFDLKVCNTILEY